MGHSNNKRRSGKRDSAIDIPEAMAAFERATGKHPLAAVDAWQVYIGAAIAAAAPTPEREKWIADCVKPFRATVGVLKGRALDELERLAMRPPDVRNIRAILVQYDQSFGVLTDDQIAKDVKAGRNWNTRLARLALRVGALNVQRHTGESAEKAVKRLANSGRMAATRSRQKKSTR